MNAVRQSAVLLAVIASLAVAPAYALSRSEQAQVDRLFAQWGGQTPGCVLGVAEKGKPVLVRAYGMADLEHNVSNGVDTIFEAGSVSKQFTAAAIALLARDGKLSLDDPARKYLPELPDYGVPLTIRHMLSHTSGLRDWGSVAEIGGWPRTTRAYTNAHLLDIVSRQSALNFAPGSNWSYSNTGYSLAAVIVERVSGMSFSQFSRERLFAPLGMDHSSWRDDHSRVLRNRAIAYSKRPDGFHTDMPFEDVVGNGGLLTTVGDLLKWNENIDHPVVGDARLWAEAQTSGTLSDGKPHYYGLGLMIGNFQGRPLLSHVGATAGYRSALNRYPAQRLSVALLCNAGNANAGNDVADVARIFLADAPSAPDPEGAPPGALASAPHTRASSLTAEQVPLSELTGTYSSADAEASYRVTEEAGALVARGRYGVVLTLRRVSGDRFRTGATGVLFRRDAQGKVTALSVVDDRVWDMRFERQP